MTSSALAADDRLAIVQQKAERANKHIGDLRTAIGAFIASRPYEFGTSITPLNGQLRYCITGMRPIPMQIPLIMGNAIHDLRAALDHLATQLYQVGTGSSGTSKDTAFYIHRKKSTYEHHFPERVRGMRQDAIDALAALEPYEGGKGELFCALHDLDIVDKHRALVAAASGLEAYDMMPSMNIGVSQKMRDHYKGVSLFMRGPSHLCPLEIGTEIPMDVMQGDVKLDPYAHFLYDVSLYEPDIIKSEPMLEIAQRFADLVGNTVKAFRPLLV